MRTIILTLICHYSGMNGKVVFSIPFLLDQEVILLRHSLLMDQVPVFLPMEEWVVFLIMGSVLPGYMFRYQYCLVGGLEAIVFGSIRWCVWSFRPSSPLRLPHLKCLLLLLLEPRLAPYGRPL